MIKLRLTGVPFLVFSPSFLPFPDIDGVDSLTTLSLQTSLRHRKLKKELRSLQMMPFCLLQVACWKFTYHQNQWNHSWWKGSLCSNESPRRAVFVLHASLLFGMEKCTLSLNPILTADWDSFHSAVCLVRDGNHLVPEWCFGQALSISKPPLGVIIAAVKRSALEGNRISHGLIISHDAGLHNQNIGKTEELRAERCGLMSRISVGVSLLVSGLVLRIGRVVVCGHVYFKSCFFEGVLETRRLMALHKVHAFKKQV